MTRRRQLSRAQAMAEIALILPLVMLLLLGVYSISEVISVQNAATTATRNGARLASELGSGGYVVGSPATDPRTIDDKVVSTVNAGLVGGNAPSGTTVVEVDIYRPDPTKPAGYFDTGDAAMLLDRYNSDGTPFSGWVAQYTLDQRDDVLGKAAQLGVRVVYNYQSPTALFAWMGGQKAAYTVMYIQPA